MADGKVPKSIRRAVFVRDGLICAACRLLGFKVQHKGSSFGVHTKEDGVYLSIDHILAASRGGNNDLLNLRVLCTRCNTGKGRKPDGAWARAGRPGSSRRALRRSMH